MAAVHHLISVLRIGRVDPEKESLYEFKPIWIFPPWSLIALVVGLFLATVLGTDAEYQEKGTVFGFPGPGFNALFNPIYEEVIFRGWILGRLVRNHSNVVAIGVSSLLFGLLHVRNIYWLDTGTLAGSMAFTGLVFGPLAGYVTLRFRSLWPAVVFHYLNNLGYYL